jgi:16S rRNA processing protein RimM
VTAPPSPRVEIGRIAKAHGLSGEVVVTGARLTTEEFAAIRDVFARAKDGSLEPLTVAATRPFMHSLLVRFAGVSDKDAADLLRGRVLEADPSRLPRPAEGTVYLFQLLGLAVRTVEGRALGAVEDVWSTGATPVLVVREPAAEGERGRERLLPMSPDVLVGVDLDEQTIEIRLLPGMEDL